MAAQMFNDNALKKFLIDDIKFEWNWSDTDNEGYDADTEEFIEKFDQVLHLTLKSSENSYDSLSADNNNVSSYHIDAHSEKSNDFNSDNSSFLTEEKNSIVDFFFLFLNDKILAELVNCINTHISVARKAFSRQRDCQNTNLEEIKVFLGLIILCGLLKFNSKLDELWEKGGLGTEVFRLTMSLQRFKFLLRYVHFTSSSEFKTIDQDNCREIDKIIGTLIHNCQQNFELGSDITISKKCLDYKTKTDRQVNEVKKGLVIYYIMDSNYCYVSNLEFYDQKKFNNSDENSITHHEALNYILNSQYSNSNVMLDKSCEKFDVSSVDLDSLLQKTVKNTHDFTSDEVLHKYSMLKKTTRFLLKLLFFIIDVACLNSFIIHYNKVNHTLSRKEFLKQLGLALVKDEIKKRATCQYLSRDLRDNAAHYLSIKCQPKTFDKINKKPVRCTVCPRKADKKVRSFCSKCEKPMCQSHMITLCCNCQEAF